MKRKEKIRNERTSFVSKQKPGKPKESFFLFSDHVFLSCRTFDRATVREQVIPDEREREREREGRRGKKIGLYVSTYGQCWNHS